MTHVFDIVRMKAADDLVMEGISHGVDKVIPLRAIFFMENINIYLHFMSFLHTNKTQVVEIPPRVRQGPAYST